MPIMRRLCEIIGQNTVLVAYTFPRRGGLKWFLFFKNKNQNQQIPKVRDISFKMMYHGPWGTPGSLRGGGGRKGLQNGPTGQYAHEPTKSLHS